jgi:N-acetylneuraminate epimerase
MKTQPLMLWCAALLNASSMAADLKWSQLPPLPDKEGFASMFAGVSNDVLIIAGGANFPDKRPWEGGTKVWYDDVWLLEKPDGTWRKIGKLPRPLGYGVSVTTHEGLLCIGGSDSKGHHAECFIIQWENSKLLTKPFPSLPQPCANMSGALVGHTVFIAGGISKSDATEALHTFWSLDLSKPDARWQELPPWPGKERMLAIAGSFGDAFYLFSGTALHADANGKPARDYLKDAFRYTAKKGWEKLPDMPRAAVAAPTPAQLMKTGLLVISGDDGSKVGFKPETQHPGFQHSVMEFDVTTSQWKPLPDAPFSRATVPVTEWRDGFVIPNGEVRPGYRTNEVWWVK